MKVLVACEESQEVCIAFRKLGHEAWSCDLKDCSGGHPEWHINDNILNVLNKSEKYWDMMIAFPDCIYLCSSGLHWNNKTEGREAKTIRAVAFVRKLMNADIPRIAIENPVGRLGTAIRKADQYIQPYQFGHDASKKTGLWLKNLPELEQTKYIEPRIVNGKKRWGNQTDSGQNRIGPSDTRSQERAKTYTGIAEAFALQWGVLSTGAQYWYCECSSDHIHDKDKETHCDYCGASVED